jgi:hypothetical protein
MSLRIAVVRNLANVNIETMRQTREGFCAKKNGVRKVWCLARQRGTTGKGQERPFVCCRCLAAAVLCLPELFVRLISGTPHAVLEQRSCTLE